MNDEILERLMLDKALGRLDNDVEKLLDAYLENNPQAGNLGREFKEIVGLSRSAMSPCDEAAALPPFPKADLLRVQRQSLWRRRVVQVSGAISLLAAGIILGFVIFAGVSLPTNTPKPLEMVHAPEVPVTQTKDSSSLHLHDSIWSKKEIEKEVREGTVSTTSTVKWISVQQRPRIGEKS